MRLRPIHHTFGPLALPAQCRLACQLLLHIKTGSAEDRAELERCIGERFNGTAIAFASGRQALCAYLQSLGYTEGEIIVQGFTCSVVPAAIRAAGLTPVFVDIDRETLNLDPEAVREAITPNTRAVICQHTFGIPSDTETLRQTCDVHGILLIEDCAHVLPDAEGPQEIGGRGDAMLLSFGRDKAISGVTGGAIVIRDREVAARVRAQEEHAEDICRCRVRRLLLYPLIYRIAKPLYGIGIGKALLVLARKLHLLLPIVTSEEKAGTLSTKLERMPADCAVLARQQWNDRAALNAHRRRCTSLYLDHATKAGWPVLRGVRADLPLQKFPLFVQSAAGIRRSLGSANIHLEDGWTGCVICPADTILASQGYVPGSDPEAEAAAEMILSLPTHPTMTEHDVNVVCTALDPLLSQ